MVRAATIRACVESSPPEMPMTTLSISEDFSRWAKSLNLDVVGLIAALIPLGRVRRDVGKAGIFALEEETSLDGVQIHLDPAKLEEGLPVGEGIPAEGGLAHPVLGETVEVDIGKDNLGIFRKPFRFREEIAVFTDHGMAVPGKIRRRFPGAGGGVEIGGDAAGGLVGRQALPVFRLCRSSRWRRRDCR